MSPPCLFWTLDAVVLKLYRVRYVRSRAASAPKTLLVVQWSQMTGELNGDVKTDKDVGPFLDGKNVYLHAGLVAELDG